MWNIVSPTKQCVCMTTDDNLFLLVRIGNGTELQYVYFFLL